jgi:hypothetical protein
VIANLNNKQEVNTQLLLWYLVGSDPLENPTSRQEEIACKQSVPANGRKRFPASNQPPSTAGRDFPRAISPRQRQEEISSEQSVPANGRKRFPASNQSPPTAGRDFPQAISSCQRREEISREQSLQASGGKKFPGRNLSNFTIINVFKIYF